MLKFGLAFIITVSAQLIISLMNAFGGGIVLDGSMGTAGALKGPDFQIKSEYGQQAGTNLFHSFKTFNVQTNETATFSGPPSIRNIISRVTGGETSYIDGLLRSTIAGANLLFMNPSGIHIGPNASLDIDGSFHLTTADYIRLGDDKFYASPIENEILSVVPPSAFGFFDSVSEPKKMVNAPITFDGKELFPESVNEIPTTGLSVPKGECISVVAGTIDINGSYYKKPIDDTNTQDVAAGTLKAPDGKIHLISMKTGGEVNIENPNISVSKAGDIRLNHTLLNTSGNGTGRISIRGGQFFAKNSIIQSDTEGSEHGGVIDIHADNIILSQTDVFTDSFNSGSGGDIVLSADQSISITDFSRIFSDTYKTGNGGSILIETERLNISNGGKVSSDSLGSGDGGMITLRGSEYIHIKDQNTTVFVGAEGKGETAGDAGGLFIETPKFLLSDEATINCDTYYGSAMGGDINISGLNGDFADSVDISNSRIYSGAINGEYQGAGHGGQIQIKSKNISISNGGEIGSESIGGGNGGDVILHALEKIRIQGKDSEGNSSKINASALCKQDIAGNAGNIILKSDQIFLSEGGSVSVSTEGPGNAGAIMIESSILELDNNASISSASQSTEYGGNAGMISIRGNQSLVLKNGSEISTATFAKQSDEGKKGNAGNIELRAAQIKLESGSSISSGSSSLTQGGDAGVISIRTSESLIISGGSSITTEAEDAGKGQIIVEAGNLLYLLNGKMTTSIKAGGEDAGDIYAKQDVLIMNGSKIVANAWEGRGGNIHLIANPFIQSANSLVDASSKLGIDGTVYIESPDDDVTSGLIVLPTNFLDATQWIKTPCAARTGESVSQFVIKGRDAMPTALYDLMPGTVLWFEEKIKDLNLTSN